MRWLHGENIVIHGATVDPGGTKAGPHFAGLKLFTIHEEFIALPRSWQNGTDLHPDRPGSCYHHLTTEAEKLSIAEWHILIIVKMFPLNSFKCNRTPFLNFPLCKYHGYLLRFDTLKYFSRNFQLDIIPKMLISQNCWQSLVCL